MKSKIKWIILALVVIILILLATILLLPKDDNKETKDVEKNTTSSNEKEEDKLKSSKELGIVVPEDDKEQQPGYKEYYTVLNCISTYLDAVNSNNSNYFGKDEDGNLVKNVSQEEINKKVQSMLSSNSSQNIEMYEEKYMYIPINMLRKTGKTVQSYAVYGVLANSNMEYINEASFIVNLDTLNNTFSIEIIANNSNISQLSVEEKDSIEENDYNGFTYQEIDEKYKSRQLFENMKYLMIVKPDIIYGRLDEEYKTNRFGSYERFKNYIDNNKDFITGVSAKRYKKSDSQVIITDQYSTRYEFEVENPSQYTVKTDNYVFLLDDDKNQYKESTEEEKAKYNINRWIKMLNYRDYEFAYNHLDEEFRNSKFETVEDFENQIKEKYPDRYVAGITKIEQDGNVWIAELELTIEDEEFSEKYMTIIIKPENEGEFSLSFDNQ